MNRTIVGLVSLFCLVSVGATLRAGTDQGAFEFVFMSDLHFHIAGLPEEALQGSAARLLQDGPGEFIITGGDYDNFPNTEKAMEQYLLQPLRERGIAYPWFAAVGNHDPEWTANNWKENNDGSGRNIKDIIARNRKMEAVITPGPGAERSSLEEYKPDGAQWTTFSFDYSNCHLVILDFYSARDFENRTLGQADPALVDWLEADLAATKQPLIFVFGHEPALAFDGVAQPGADPAPIDPTDRMDGERERFWQVLQSDERVVAYVCGHTHRYGLIRDGALWQLCTAQEWIGLKMFVKFFVAGDSVTARVYQWSDSGYTTQDHKLR